MAKRTTAQSSRSPDAGDAAVGPRIRAARLKLKMSQGDLGDKVGITFQQIRKYENNESRVSMGRLANIAEILGVTVTFLLTGAQEKRGARAGNEGDALFKKQGALHLLKAYNRMDRGTRQAMVELCESIARR